MSVKRKSVAGPALPEPTEVLVPPGLDLAGVSALVREKLGRRCWPSDGPVPILSQIEADLEAAEGSALVGVNLPPDAQSHGLKGRVKSLLIKCVLRITRPISRPQCLFNTSILKCLDALMAWGHRQEEEALALRDRVVNLEAQLAEQEARLRELEQLLLDKRGRKAA